MTTKTLPSRAKVVIVGGGIAGCSVAYHLAQLGQTEVLLLEQGKLTCGTTWHAAGLVGQMRPNRNMTRMSKYGIDLYSSLEAKTGLATGWKQCGSVNVARTPERMQVLRKQIALARSFGVEVHEISPQEVGERAPTLRTDDLAGGIWIPGDGKANPADLCMSLAKGARQGGVHIVEDIQVTGVQLDKGRVKGICTEQGDVECEILVNCAGQWARQFGRLAGVNVPLYSAEHFYIVTDKIEGIHPMWPVVRDPDGFIYYKEEVGGLVMGGFEPVAKPWRVDPIAASFQFELLGEDWDQFEVLMQNAIHRTPCLETAKIKMLLNGPESFTPDGNFILGEASEVKNYFVCAGFNSAGIANSGGAGRLMAEWIVGGQASVDLWDVDVRRFAPFTGNRKALAERTAETLGLHYAMRWPRQELQTVRPLRCSPLYDLLAAKGAEFGSKNGWERANYFRPLGAAPAQDTLGTPDWLPWVQAEQAATRDAVALYDQSSFSKIWVQGPDALALLQYLCANEMDVPIGKMVYTALLNERGGFESDLTVIRLSEDKFLVVTGSGQTTRDLDWLQRHVRPEMSVVINDVSAQYCVLSLMGPKAAQLLSRVCPDDLSPQALPFAFTREIDVGHACVRAARMSYVGGPGYELYIPVEMTRHVYLSLHQAGADLSLRDAGYYALDALRIERGRRAWGAEMGPDETPYEAGLWAGVCIDKAAAFKGQDALRVRANQALEKKLVKITASHAHHYLWGGEPLMVNGEFIGEVTSAGWGFEAQAVVALGYVRGPWAQRPFNAMPAQAELWGQGVAIVIQDLE
ncbi:MAG: FAD-dependent oxidoreductase [Betaproteobacteria bacterium]|nr:FAD-dependent oxidoreductase [Betaproteobacteria bacterium]